MEKPLFEISPFTLSTLYGRPTVSTLNYSKLYTLNSPLLLCGKTKRLLRR